MSKDNRVSKDTKSAAPQIKKVQANKAKPSSNITLTLLEDPGVKKNYFRVYVAKPEGKPLEAVIHRPIGIHDLDKDNDWVVSSPDEVGVLIARQKDPDQLSFDAKRTKWIRAKAVTDKKMSYPNGQAALPTTGKDRNLFLQEFEKDCLERNKGVKNYKFNATLELNAAATKTADIQDEINFRIWKESADKDVKKTIPHLYRTCKGSFYDTPQVSVVQWKNWTIDKVMHHVYLHGVNPTLPQEVNSIPGSVTVSSSNTKGEQWFFASGNIPSEKKKKARILAKALRDYVGKEYKIEISDA
jgi:hypothetical protein